MKPRDTQDSGIQMQNSWVFLLDYSPIKWVFGHVEIQLHTDLITIFEEASNFFGCQVILLEHGS